MAGLEDDPAIDTLVPVASWAADVEPSDYIEMREGPPPWIETDPAPGVEPTAAAGALHAAVKLLASRDLKVVVAVVDAYTGEELWTITPSGTYRFGERLNVVVDLDFSLA